MGEEAGKGWGKAQPEKASDLGQGKSEATDLSGKGRIDHLGAQVDDKSTDQGGVDTQLELNGLGAGNGLHFLIELGLLLLAQGCGRGDFGQCDLAKLAVELEKALEHGIENGDPLAVGQQLEQVLDRRRHLTVKQCRQSSLLGFWFQYGRCHRFTQLGTAVPQDQKLTRLGGDGVGLLAGFSHLKQRFGVRGGKGIEEWHQEFPRLAMDVSSRRT